MARTCACPCRQPLNDHRVTALYVNEAHKQRAYRERASKRQDAVTSLFGRLGSKPRRRPEIRRTTT